MTPEQELDLRMAEPPGTTVEVVMLRVAFPDSPRTYTYAALRVGGAWWLTGRDGGTEHSWGSLIAWLKNKDAEIVSLQRASSWEDIL